MQFYFMCKLHVDPEWVRSFHSVYSMSARDCPLGWEEGGGTGRPAGGGAEEDFQRFAFRKQIFLPPLLCLHSVLRQAVGLVYSGDSFPRGIKIVDHFG